jgi:hypothetical protein
MLKIVAQNEKLFLITALVKAKTTPFSTFFLG